MQNQKNNGWIKIYKKIFDNPYMGKPAYLSVWIWILTHTEHGMKFENNKWIDKKPEEMPSIIWKGERIYLKKGEFTFGAYRIARDTGVKRGTVERVIKTFKNEEQIEVQGGNKFSFGKVIKWEEYQENKEVNEEQMRNKRGTDEDVTKNIKKEKNNTCLEILSVFQETTGRKTTVVDEKAVEYWLDFYSLEEILQAIRNIPANDFWKDKMTPVLLFRRRNPRGDAVDWIGQLLNKEKKEIDWSRTDNVI